ncbi:MAG: methionine ABC transporter ATP-binding protein [[Ruminococcus] gnavus]|nr:methionine ABC transporter ATP-binding protein [Mediterraneibacter gnavus]
MAEIKIENVSKMYSSKEGTVQALKNVNLTIRTGEIYGIIGMSGAGKSTLIRCLNFLEQPTSGNVYIRGKALGGLKEKELRKQREQIGMIFQHFNLLMQKSVLENICFPMYIQGKKKKEARKKAEELLEIVGLREKAKAFPSQLSGGQKQRVAIARALAASPKILLCDEATSALDPQTTASILELLKEINHKFGITIVIITHQMSVVRKVCSHVAIMKEGEVIETGSVSEIFSHPKSSVARELLRQDEGDGNTKEQIQSGKRVRIVFSENSAFQPVIANMILKFREPVNILSADTRNIGGIAKGEMILEFANGSRQEDDMKRYLKECGVELEEVTEDVE